MKINVRVINVTNSLIPLTVLKISVANITGGAVGIKELQGKELYWKRVTVQNCINEMWYNKYVYNWNVRLIDGLYEWSKVGGVFRLE